MDNQINIKYMFTVIGGGWERVSRAYFIADDRVYFLNKFSPDDLKMLENHFDDMSSDSGCSCKSKSSGIMRSETHWEYENS